MEKRKSFWTTLPGILAAIAGLIAAVASLLTVLNQTGVIGNTRQMTQDRIEQGRADKRALSAPRTTSHDPTLEPEGKPGTANNREGTELPSVDQKAARESRGTSTAISEEKEQEGTNEEEATEQTPEPTEPERPPSDSENKHPRHGGPDEYFGESQE
jgi:hypothetical protein